MSRIIKFENIYFGRNSLVKLFANKTHIENSVDYDGTTLAFLLDVSDFTNTDALLSHFAIVNGNEIIPILMEWNLRTIHGRLLILVNQLPGPHDTKMLLKNFESAIEGDQRPETIKYIASQYAKALTNAKSLQQVYNFLVQRIYQLKSIGIKRSLEEVRRLAEVYR
jgi:hypothetical protein